MSSDHSRRQPYSGFQRKLVIAFDVGTTFSGASYAILEPGQIPHIQGVTQFPGQQRVGGDSKIPSVVYYDENGRVVAAGAEADPETNYDLADAEGLTRAEWFKLHLRPPHLAAEQGFDVRTLPPLPRNKSANEIFGDLLKYLYESTRRYIQERQGASLWESVENSIEYVLSHPNGWEGQQQNQMRKAAVFAGLVSNDSEAMQRISFVTEGEASLCFCLNTIPSASNSHNGKGVMVVDCGGGTIDISTYTRNGSKFKEIAPPECLLQGSIFVTNRAHAFLREKLSHSQFGSEAELEVMKRYFDKTTKPTFKNASKPCFVKFGRPTDSDPTCGVRSGSVKLSGTEIASFFDPAVTNILRVIGDQRRRSTVQITTIFLVGGFATSDYLFSQLSEHLKAWSIDLLRPDAYLNKAVAEGAVSYHIDHFVSSRMAKYSYGIECCPLYNPSNPEHRSRQHRTFVVPSGERWVNGGFSTILAKSVEVSEEKEFRRHYRNVFAENEFNSLVIKSSVVKCYRGNLETAPEWLDKAPGFFPDLCKITANVSEVKRTISPQFNRSGQKYYNLDFDVVLLFGLTELKAQIAWNDNGVEKRGPASIVYDVNPTVN
ncbi:hypothetical protein AMATHDRAFT_5374 [Amanita thiersii Skay4041]|uniref:Uncharacterized protein n=1 Tax=Amanita thiersii Skay4041 TaxID=703135 RepID=A0A2A9NMK6_9AGAR|nr:hypothetical protein AMATHDRAFT_5374 [Amanita thiersii Skay4041]